MCGEGVSGCVSIGGYPLYSFLSGINYEFWGEGVFTGCVGKNFGMLGWGWGGGVGLMY